MFLGTGEFEVQAKKDLVGRLYDVMKIRRNNEVGLAHNIVSHG